MHDPECGGHEREHGITPRGIQKSIQESLAVVQQARETEELVAHEAGVDYNVQEVVAQLEREMVEAAEALEFERAALLRDQVHELKEAHHLGGQSTARPQVSLKYKMRRRAGPARKRAGESP